MHTHRKRRCCDCRHEGYDIARWLILKEILDRAERMKTKAGRRLFMNVAEHIVQKMTAYDGGIPKELPEWAIGDMKEIHGHVR